MGQATQEKKDRNEALYRDYLTGMDYVEMVGKYSLTSQRIWQILKRYKKMNSK